MPAETRICRVCLIPHDEEIHAATLDVRNWFREQVTQGFFEDQDPAAQLDGIAEGQVA